MPNSARRVKDFGLSRRFPSALSRLFEHAQDFLVDGLVAGGEPGATKAIKILKREIDLTMAQMGCPALSDLGPDFVLWDQDELRRNRRV